MAALSLAVSGQLQILETEASEIVPMVPAAKFTPGDVVYLATTGLATAASAAASTTAGCPGLVLDTGNVRQGISVLRRGKVSGFDLSALAYGAKVYLSDTVKTLADAAGTTSVVVGKVVPLSDNSLTKVLYFDPDWRA